MSDRVPQLTLDTNLLHDYWKQRKRKETIETLIALARRGEVELAVTARIREDVPRDPLASEINKLGWLSIEEIGSVTRADYWVLGRDYVASADFAAFEKELNARAGSGQRIPDWKDLDHVHAHFLRKRDAFLTWDEPILALADELRERFGIVVLRPDDWLRSRQS